MDFDYKNYSLSKLEDWMHDAMSCAEASPQEIYDTIKNVVQENFDAYQKTTERCRELLVLLNGHQPVQFNIDPAGNQVNVCDTDNTSDYCNKSWNSFWEDNTSKEDKVVKWRLPVEVDGPSGEYYVLFPDDLMEAANLKENDLVEWVDNFDGSWTLKKVDNPADENLKD